MGREKGDGGIPTSTSLHHQENNNTEFKSVKILRPSESETKTNALKMWDEIMNVSLVC